MGQAQSQSMGTLDCSDCEGSGDQGEWDDNNVKDFQF